MKSIGVAYGLFLLALVAIARDAVAEPFASGVFRKVDGRIDKAQVTGFVVTFPGGKTRECMLVQREDWGPQNSRTGAVAVTCDWP